MQVQDTTPRTILAPNGLILPTIITDRTPLEIFDLIETAFAEANGEVVSRATLHLALEAVRDSSAIVVLYVGADGGQDARVLWPSRLALTKENNLACRAYCTLRKQWKTFRLDRMLTCHALTTPDDIAA